MKNKIDYKNMYLKSNNGNIKAIDILNCGLSDTEKITLCLRTLISTAQLCEDLYVESCHEYDNILSLES